MRKYTQQQKIVALMCQNPQREWWKAHDLIEAGKDELYIGYEATARVSEVIRAYPDAFDVKQEGKYRLVRLRFEDGSAWYRTLPKDLREVVSKYYRRPEVEATDEQANLPTVAVQGSLL